MILGGIWDFDYVWSAAPKCKIDGLYLFYRILQVAKPKQNSSKEVELVSTFPPDYLIKLLEVPQILTSFVTRFPFFFFFKYMYFDELFNQEV